MITYDSDYGHVCSCAQHRAPVCNEQTGEIVEYVDTYDFTVEVRRDVEPTESGSWLYACKRCGSCAWSGL